MQTDIQTHTDSVVKTHTDIQNRKQKNKNKKEKKDDKYQNQKENQNENENENKYPFSREITVINVDVPTAVFCTTVFMVGKNDKSFSGDFCVFVIPTTVFCTAVFMVDMNDMSFMGTNTPTTCDTNGHGGTNKDTKDKISYTKSMDSGHTLSI